MPSTLAPSRVLVTGANGFIAIWVVKLLLERGYAVRGVSRSEAKNAHLQNLFGTFVEQGKLELAVVGDITEQGAFDEVVKGVDAIAHTASPCHLNADDPNELIGPAVRGTVGILESALKYAPLVKRIVVLSSCAAISNPTDRGLLDESNWSTVCIREVRERGRNASQFAKYKASKSLAEKAAWDFVDQHSTNIGWDLVTLCPPYVFGPILHEVSSPTSLNASMKGFYASVVSCTELTPTIEAFQASWIDVRDVAEALVRSLSTEEAGGKRFIVSKENFVWQDWYDTANTLNIPGVRVPVGKPGSGATVQHVQVFSSTRAKTVLGLEFKEKGDTLRDIIASFKEKGW